MFLDLLFNPLPYPLDILQHVVIPEPYHSNVQFLEIPITMSIIIVGRIHLHVVLYRLQWLTFVQDSKNRGHMGLHHIVERT